MEEPPYCYITYQMSDIFLLEFCQINVNYIA